MSGVSVTLRPAKEPDLEYVEQLLRENDLPTEDVRSKAGSFYVGGDAGDRVGVGGVEVYGSDGLLRSVVVERSARGAGVGSGLCEALEATAVADGVETLNLLTTTAAGFFEDLGYERIEREGAPEAIRETAQFDSLCPASAACMRKHL